MRELGNLFGEPFGGYLGGTRLAGGGALPFSDTFTRGDGVLGGPWLGGASWAIVSGVAVNTPTLGSELLTNGDMELDDSVWGDVGPPTTNERSNEQAHGGTYSRKIVANTNNGARQGINAVTGVWYRAGGWLYSTGAEIKINSDIGGGHTIGSTHTAAAWAERLEISRAAATSTQYIRLYSVADPATGYFDDVSVKALTLASLFNVINVGTPNVDVSAAATIVAGTQAGVVVNLDSVSSPANFVIGYHDGTSCKLEKAVGGTYTTLISVTTAYSAGAAVRVVKDGTDFSLYYGASQVGTTQTISDAGIISNVNHGLFSTSELNTLDTFTITAM